MTHLALRLTTRSEARNTQRHALRLTARSEAMTHLALRLTVRSEARNTQRHALHLTARSEAMTHLALRLTRLRSEARNIYILPLSGRVLSDYTKLISKVFKLYTR
jgi:hypothetical protein